MVCGDWGMCLLKGLWVFVYCIGDVFMFWFVVEWLGWFLIGVY